MKHRFSVLMPAYNRGNYVRQAIDSVLSQTFTDYELIVVDDGSTDQTPEILKSYGDQIKSCRQKNSGPEVARNTGLALAEGEYLVLLDSDDFLFPFALATYDRMIRAFDSPPVVLGSEIYYRNGDPLPAEALLSSPAAVEVLKFPDYLSKTVPLTNFNSKLVVRTSLVRAMGGFRNSTLENWYNDDLNTMLLMGTQSPCIVLRKPYTVAYRKHDANSLHSVKAVADGILVLARSERRGEYPGGVKRLVDRYAVIGGRASTWAFRYCWRGGERKLALRLLFGTAPMVLAAVAKKLQRQFVKPIQPVVMS